MRPSPSKPFLIRISMAQEVDFLLILLEWLNEWFETMAIDFKGVYVVGIQ